MICVTQTSELNDDACLGGTNCSSGVILILCEIFSSFTAFMKFLAIRKDTRRRQRSALCRIGVEL